MKTIEPIDKERFGIAGDGVTDDSAAIQKFLDAGYKLGQLPVGTYLAEGLIIRDRPSR